MVTNVTSLTRSGLSDFLVQRVSAVIIAAYVICVLGYLIANPGLNHAQLVGYFGSLPMKLFSSMAILSTAAHAWIGMWTVGTDYLREAHVGAGATALRLVYQSLCVLVLFVFVAWGLTIFWGLPS